MFRNVVRIMVGFTVFASVFLLSSHATAQLEQDWLQRLSATQGFIILPVDVAVDSAGNSFVTGSAGPFNDTDVMTIKYAPDGTELWTAIHPGGTGRFVGVNAFGDVVVVAGFGGDFGIIKYDASNGVELWSKRHDPGGIDRPEAATLDADGHIYITGRSWTTDQNDYYTVEFDANGSVLWSARYNGNGAFLFAHDIPHAIAVDQQGNVFVTGESNAPGRAVPDFVTIKYDGSNGNQLWLRRYAGAGANDIAFDLVLDGVGDAYVTGGSVQGSGWKFVTIKYRSSDGSQLWLATDSPQLCNVATNIALDRAGNIVITGWTDPDCDKSNFNENIATVKHRASDGMRLWSTSFGSDLVGEFDLPHDLIIDSADDIFVTGENSGKFIILQYDSATGDITAMDAFVSGSNELAAGKALALDSAQNILIGGVARNGNTEHRDILTVKYLSRAGGVYELQITNLIGGADATFSITNATPNRKQFIVYSLKGMGSTFIPQLNVTLDLAKPILLTSGVADGAGQFDAIVHIPQRATGRTVWFQGAELNNTTAAFSKVVQ